MPQFMWRFTGTCLHQDVCICVCVCAPCAYLFLVTHLACLWACVKSCVCQKMPLLSDVLCPVLNLAESQHVCVSVCACVCVCVRML